MLYVTKVNDRFVGYVLINDIAVKVMTATSFGDVRAYCKMRNLKFRAREVKEQLYIMQRVEKW